jgi:hypothetical protein
MASTLLWSTLLSCNQLLIGISLFSILNVGLRYWGVCTRVHQHHEMVAQSVLSDGANVTQTIALVVGNNNVA